MYGNFTENFRIYGELGQDFGILDFRIATFVRILTGILWIKSQGKPDSVRGGPLVPACTAVFPTASRCICITVC